MLIFCINKVEKVIKIHTVIPRHRSLRQDSSAHSDLAEREERKVGELGAPASPGRFNCCMSCRSRHYHQDVRGNETRGDQLVDLTRIKKYTLSRRSD